MKQTDHAPLEPQIKKHFTPEEHAMRRAEMARRRKNLSEKRNEEEKADTINRLLKKQAPKRRGKISQAEIEAQDRGDDEEEGADAGGKSYSLVSVSLSQFPRWPQSVHLLFLIDAGAPCTPNNANNSPLQAKISRADPLHPETDYVPPANPVFVRWVSSKSGCIVGVPSEWLGTKMGRVFGESREEAGKMVEEIKA